MKHDCEMFKSAIIDYSVKKQIEHLLQKEKINETVIQAYLEDDIVRQNLEGIFIRPSKF